MMNIKNTGLTYDRRAHNQNKSIHNQCMKAMKQATHDGEIAKQHLHAMRITWVEFKLADDYARLFPIPTQRRFSHLKGYVSYWAHHFKLAEINRAMNKAHRAKTVGNQTFNYITTVLKEDSFYNQQYYQKHIRRQDDDTTNFSNPYYRRFMKSWLVQKYGKHSGNIQYGQALSNWRKENHLPDNVDNNLNVIQPQENHKQKGDNK